MDCPTRHVQILECHDEPLQGISVMTTHTGKKTHKTLISVSPQVKTTIYHFLHCIYLCLRLSRQALICHTTAYRSNDNDDTKRIQKIALLNTTTTQKHLYVQIGRTVFQFYEKNEKYRESNQENMTINTFFPPYLFVLSPVSLEIFCKWKFATWNFQSDLHAAVPNVVEILHSSYKPDIT